MTEYDIIDLLTQGLPQAPALFGIGDDAALVEDGRVITQDTMIEGVHWDDKLSPADVGWKIVAVNASDIGAMGAIPEWATLSLSLPSRTPRSWLHAFSQGMHEALTHWGIRLIGGDTTTARNDICLTMCMGSQRSTQWAWQHTAEVGDSIWVTGTLGDAALGFFEAINHPQNPALRRPHPPLQFAQAITAAGLVHCMTDISDGLSREIHRICLRSNKGALLLPERLPCSADLVEHPHRLAYQTAFGEDYEYLFTSAPENEHRLRELACLHHTTVHQIGQIRPSQEGVRLHGCDWPKSLFQHFSE